VIVWLNGAFGCGKTTTANELLPLIPASRLFGPETVGSMLGPNLADYPVSDFQHWPPWRPLVVATATELTRFTGQHLIAPRQSWPARTWSRYSRACAAPGSPVFHVVLDAGEGILRQRIEGSGEAQAWRLAHLAGYRASRSWLIPAANLVVDTGCRTPSEVAHQIAGALPDYEDP
jgi:hypothetical protein